MRSIKGTKRLHPLAKHNLSRRVANTLFVQIFRLNICKGLAWQSTNCGVVVQVFLLSACALSVCSVILPVSSDQGAAFKNLDTKIVYQSNAWGGCGKKCVSIGEATAAGENWQNLRSHFEKGYMEFSTPEEVEMGTSTKSTHDANHGADRFEFIPCMHSCFEKWCGYLMDRGPNLLGLRFADDGLFFVYSRVEAGNLLDAG